MIVRDLCGRCPVCGTTDVDGDGCGCGFDLGETLAEVERLRRRCAVLEEAALRDGAPLPVPPVEAVFVDPELSEGEG